MSWITRIDKLTHSIEEASTGKSFDTEVHKVKKADLLTVNPANRWNFNGTLSLPHQALRCISW